MSDVGLLIIAVDIAIREAADVILLDKDLFGLRKATEGCVYANMTKYIKVTAALTFGNIFLPLVCVCLPAILTDGTCASDCAQSVYDLSCIALLFDNVDPEFLKEPRAWSQIHYTLYGLDGANPYL